MKLLSKACILIMVLLALGSVSAFAEQYAWTSDLQRDVSTTHDSLWIETTPELGDSSIATAALVGLSGLALTGAVVAHKKARSYAQ